MRTIIFLFSFCLLVMGCDKEKKQDPTIKKEVSYDLEIGLMPTLACLPYYVAQAQGLYDSLNISVRIHTYNSQTECNRALQNKEIDAGYTDIFRAVLLHQANPAYGFITGFQEEWQLIPARNLRLRNIRQIESRTVAISRNSLSDYLCDYLATRNRLSKEEVYRPQINSLPLRKKMLENNQIESAILPLPTSLDLTLKGNSALFSTSGMGYTFTGLLTLQAQYKDKRSLFIKLNQGYVHAVRTLKEQNNLADSILKRTYGISKPTIDSVLQLKLPYPQQIRKSDLMQTEAWLKERGLWNAKKGEYPAILE